ncbi:hypothetical protein WICMUC_003148 [Wickerhamomyces mucosus]|uniref:Uncharacterized protein n=1 Tax=Wickerhamomyces mucosus TaxID=1378264 RepID=A0A9P8PMH3_9ASCO|nr:hypothetical protein WICMUC_003148 [Wickerhamomyces mucosus]
MMIVKFHPSLRNLDHYSKNEVNSSGKEVSDSFSCFNSSCKNLWTSDLCEPCLIDEVENNLDDNETDGLANLEAKVAVDLVAIDLETILIELETARLVRRSDDIF